MKPAPGIEPGFPPYHGDVLTVSTMPAMETAVGFEPTSLGLRPSAQPLSYAVRYRNTALGVELLP